MRSSVTDSQTAREQIGDEPFKPAFSKIIMNARQKNNPDHQTKSDDYTFYFPNWPNEHVRLHKADADETDESSSV